MSEKGKESPKVGFFWTEKRVKREKESESELLLDRKRLGKGKGVQKLASFRQETGWKRKRSPKASLFWTGNGWKRENESKSRLLLDRKQVGKGKGVQKLASFGQETAQKRKRSPKASLFWTGNGLERKKESESELLLDRKRLGKGKGVQKSAPFRQKGPLIRTRIP